MLVFILVDIIGALLFLFLFWRRLKEDYSANIIFSIAFFILLGVLGGYLASRYFFPSWFFWFEGFGAFLGFSLGIVKFNTRFFETFEASFIAFLPWISLFYFSEFLKKPSFLLAVPTVLIFSLVFVFDFINMHYKNFRWYKSGRIGVAGLLVAGSFFLIRAAIATFFPFMISFSGRSEIILSGVCAFSIFLLVYNLSKSQK